MILKYVIIVRGGAMQSARLRREALEHDDVLVLVLGLGSTEAKTKEYCVKDNSIRSLFTLTLPGSQLQSPCVGKCALSARATPVVVTRTAAA